ncbi:MAG: hypothetical protein ABIR26_01555 [Ramlibacter sp.]
MKCSEAIADVDDPARVADAFRQAQHMTKEGQSCLLEFITSPETAFSHRFGAAERGAPVAA